MNRRKFLLAAGTGASAATAGCSTVFDRGSSGSIGERDASPYTDDTEHWPRDGFDTANTGYNPDVSLLPSEFDARRISQDGDAIDTWGAAVAVAGGRLYFGTPNEGLFAVEPDGAVRWHDERWGIGGPVTAAGDRLCVSAGAGPFSAGNVHVLEP